MDVNNVDTLVCQSPQDMQVAQQAEIAILEGLGGNILEHLGNVELGQPIKIFIRNQVNKVVGGVIANCFGGWM